MWRSLIVINLVEAWISNFLMEVKTFDSAESVMQALGPTPAVQMHVDSVDRRHLVLDGWRQRQKHREHREAGQDAAVRLWRERYIADWPPAQAQGLPRPQ